MFLFDVTIKQEDHFVYDYFNMNAVFPKFPSFSLNFPHFI